MTTALFTHPDCLGHVTPPGHPEQVARLTHVLDALDGLALDRHQSPLADDADLLRCHPAAYLDRIRAAEPDTGTSALDADTHMSPGSVQAAYRSAGGICAALDHVMAGKSGNAFAAGRPPGHHAERETPMGFCLFGNAAIAAKRALDHHGLNRVAVVDFDVHHGNGTQDLLWDEPRALVATSQQMPLWPGTGAASETGAHNNVINLPLDPGTDGSVMRQAYGDHILPRLDAFQPELILISAGFDAHRDDPLAQLEWDIADFVWLTDALCDLAGTHAQGRVVSALEGGYDLPTLAASAKAHVETLIRRAG